MANFRRLDYHVALAEKFPSFQDFAPVLCFRFIDIDNLALLHERKLVNAFMQVPGLDVPGRNFRHDHSCRHLLAVRGDQIPVIPSDLFPFDPGLFHCPFKTGIVSFQGNELPGLVLFFGRIDDGYSLIAYFENVQGLLLLKNLPE
jgi:hypothetical protein